VAGWNNQRWSLHPPPRRLSGNLRGEVANLLPDHYAGGRKHFTVLRPADGTHLYQLLGPKKPAPVLHLRLSGKCLHQLHFVARTLLQFCGYIYSGMHTTSIVMRKCDAINKCRYTTRNPSVSRKWRIHTSTCPHPHTCWHADHKAFFAVVCVHMYVHMHVHVITIMLCCRVHVVWSL